MRLSKSIVRKRGTDAVCRTVSMDTGSHRVDLSSKFWSEQRARFNMDTPLGEDPFSERKAMVNARNPMVIGIVS